MTEFENPWAFINLLTVRACLSAEKEKYLYNSENFHVKILELRKPGKIIQKAGKTIQQPGKTIEIIINCDTEDSLASIYLRTNGKDANPMFKEAETEDELVSQLVAIRYTLYRSNWYC